MRCVAAVLLTAALGHGASVSGTVWLVQDRTRRPLAGVRVTINKGDTESSLQTVFTDAQGRYRSSDPPSKRITIIVHKPGYFGLAKAAGENKLTVDLSAGDVEAADFEMQQGGVITGRVTDPWGGPLEDVPVIAFHVTHYGGLHREPAAVGRSDDRGVYRLFGLAPQKYLLCLRPPSSDRDHLSPALVYYPGAGDETQATELEITPGAEIKGIDISLRPQPGFRVIGKLIGVPAEELARASIEVSRGEGRSFGMPLQPDGTFTIPRLAAGRHVISAFARSQAGPQRFMARQTIDLQADLTDLVLTAARPGGISGRLNITGPGRPKPESITLRVLNRARPYAGTSVARAPDYRFEFNELWPETYTFELEPGIAAYISKVRIEGSESSDSVTVPEGGAVQVDVDLGIDFGQITGRIKAAGAGPLPHGRVALARAGTSPLEFRAVAADQKGQFVIPGVRPGDYLLCAWPRVDTRRLYGPEIWEKAGRAVKRFTVEPGAQIEIQLTVAP